MFGRTLLGARLRDLRSVLAYLAARDDLAGRPVGLWGESFAQVNADAFEVVPLNAQDQPRLAEPAGAILAMLGGLFRDEVAAVAARGGLVSFASILDHWACYVPHDCIVPGVFRTGDLADLAAAIAPTPVRLAGMVDGLNRAVPPARVGDTFAPAQTADADAPLAEWLGKALREAKP